MAKKKVSTLANENTAFFKYSRGTEKQLLNNYWCMKKREVKLMRQRQIKKTF